jgi:hypothetical protein
MLGRGYEYMDLEPEPDDLTTAAAVASGQGAGPLGFAGTAAKETAQAAGLTTLAGDAFGNGPTTPMTPGTRANDPGDLDGT